MTKQENPPLLKEFILGVIILPLAIIWWVLLFFYFLIFGWWLKKFNLDWNNPFHLLKLDKIQIIDRSRYIAADVRNAVWDRDKGKCVYCNKKPRKRNWFRKEVKLEFGHYIPFSHGGDNCEDNIQLECFDCNRSKSTGIWKSRDILGFNKGARGCTKHQKISIE